MQLLNAEDAIAIQELVYAGPVRSGGRHGHYMRIRYILRPFSYSHKQSSGSALATCS